MSADQTPVTSSSDPLACPFRQEVREGHCHLFEKIAQMIPVGLFATDAEGLCRYANAAMVQLMGEAPTTLLAEQDWLCRVHPEERGAVVADWNEAVRRGEPFRREFRLMGTDPASWVQCHAFPVHGRDGAATAFVGAVVDASEYRDAQARLDFLAYHDSLTALPNRDLARDRLRQAISFAGRGGFRVALLLVDLDHFKMINESLGHSAGDAVLVAVAERLQGCVREADTVSRLGGDEFLMILTDLRASDSVATAAGKILQVLSEPLTIDGREVEGSVSLGIAVYPDDGSDFDTLLGKADTALYQAKASGRNAYRFYAEQMNADALHHFEVRGQLRWALARGEFELHYQPVASVVDGTVVGVEALIRWNHPELGMTYPDGFISVAEDSGLIVPIGEWVLQEACRQAAEWQRQGAAPLFVAVNLSEVQFRRGDIAASVVAALVESGLDPALLELELTESMLIDNDSRVLSAIDRLAGLGVRFSIDDFGTGYSNLAYLKRFRVHKLKIDRSFISNLCDSLSDAAIVRAIIQMARALNLQVVAEGVEDRRTLAFLKEQECDLMQGYYFSKPLRNPFSPDGDIALRRSGGL